MHCFLGKSTCWYIYITIWYTEFQRLQSHKTGPINGFQTVAVTQNRFSNRCSHTNRNKSMTFRGYQIPDTPRMPYMPPHWPPKPSQLIGIYGSPMECLGISSSCVTIRTLCQDATDWAAPAAWSEDPRWKGVEWQALHGRAGGPINSKETPSSYVAWWGYLWPAASPRRTVHIRTQHSSVSLVWFKGDWVNKLMFRHDGHVRHGQLFFRIKQVNIFRDQAACLYSGLLVHIDIMSAKNLNHSCMEAQY